MKITPYWPVLLAAFIALLFLAGIKPAESKAVAMCGTINIPTKKGGCRYTTIKRFGKAYRVRVCLR